MAKKLVVEIVGDSSSLERALTRSSRAADDFGTKVRKASLVAGAALGAGLAVAAKIGFDEIAEGQKVAAQTAATLESTGGVANVTAKQIAGLAEEQSKLTGIDDELIQTGENLLLTFKNVRNEVGRGNDVFDRATKSALDLSTAGFGSVESASKMLGKALNDPIKGMTALGRAGVTFSQSQKDAIKRLVETGDTLGAQRLILKEVESQVGGSAKAYGQTLPGQLAKARNAFDEMAGSVMVVLVPALTVLAATTAKVAQFFTEHQTAAKVLVGGLVALAGVLVTVGVATKIYAAGQAIASAATAAWTAAQWLLNAALTANPIGIVVVALAALVAGLILAWKNSETFRRIVTGAFDAVKTAATAVLNFFRDHWKTIAVLISGPFAPLVLLATDAFGIRSKLIAAATAILDFFKGHWKEIAVIISGPFAPLVALATDAFGIRSALVRAFEFIVDAVREKVGAVVAVVAALPGRIVKALGNLGSLLYGAGEALIQGLWDGVSSKAGAFLDYLGGLASKAKSVFTLGLAGSPEYFTYYVGKDVMGKFQQGLEEGFPDVERSLQSNLSSLKGGVAPEINVETPIVLDQLRSTLATAPDVVPTTDALVTVGESLDATTAQVGALTTSITDMPVLVASALAAFVKVVKTELQKLPKILEPVEAAILSIAYAIHEIGAAAYYTRAALKDTVDEILALQARIGGLNLKPDGRAAGGPVRAGQAYIVGEVGPELFIPSQSGTIHTAKETSGMGAVGGSVVNLVFNGPTVGTSREFEDTVRRALYDVGRRNPGSGLVLA